jgi:lipopolysaccharide transport system permease protein
VLLALRRLFGFADSATAEDAADRDWRSRKWVIEPTRLGFRARAEELWRYRRILWFFTVNAVRERYEGMTLGPFWLFARPLMPILIMTAVFGGLLRVPSQGVPYILFFIAGSSCWRIFERSLLWVSKSLEQNKGLLKKVYFPRIIAPIASVAPAVVEFLVLLAMLVVMCVVYFFKDGVWYLRLGPQTLVAGLAVAMTVFFAISMGLWTSVLQVRHRDVQYSIRYVLQFWQYLTPVIYPLSALPEKYHFIMYLNPMAPLVEMYKWAMLGLGVFPTGPLLSGVVLILLTFAGGLIFFSRSEAVAVDKL